MSTTLLERPEPQPDPDPQEIRGTVRLTERDLKIQRRVTLVMTVLPPLAIVAAIWLWWRGISGTSLGIMIGFYSFSVLGITVGFHRLFTHRSFLAVRPLKILLAIAGSMALEGSVTSWVATHRRHHAFADEYGDPHSPHLAKAPGMRGVLYGLWYSHVGWLFDEHKSDPEEWSPDMLADRDMVRINGRFGTLTLATFFLPPILGYLISGTWGGMVSAFLWGSLARIFLVHHMTWSINSICHFYGKEAYRARDESKNVWPLAIPSFGESWHNNHHAFPWSAKLGLRAWEIDLGWYALAAFRAAGLVTNVKVPTREQMEAKRIR